MSRAYKIKNPNGIYFVTFGVVKWVDVFTRQDYRNIVVESLKFCQKKKGLLIYAWVIMSNHIHLVISAKEGNLSDIIRDFKKFTCFEIISKIESSGVESRKEWMLEIFKESGSLNCNNTYFQFWQQDSHPKEIFRGEVSFGDQKLEYIHNNPVKAGIVERSEYYLYSSAIDYSGGRG